MSTKKPWSEQTTDERVNTAILMWEKNLARIDPDGTAWTHDLYLSDPMRFHIAAAYQSFLETLHRIKDRTE